VSTERTTPEERSAEERAEEERAKREAPDTARALRTRAFLWELLAAAEKGPDEVTRRNAGWYDVQDFLDAIDTGRPHPLLAWWEERKVDHRPPPGLPEQRARNVVTLMCVALERAGHSKRDAQERAASAIAAKANIFPNGPPSPHTIAHWQRAHGPLTSGEDWLIKHAIACGSDDEIVKYFVGLIHFALGPEPAYLLPKDDGAQ
jgi:hypothetical protein